MMRGLVQLDQHEPDIDPRIRARRAQVARDRLQRSLRVARWVAMAAAVPLLLFGLTRSPGLDVDRIEVGGAQRSGVRNVASASGITFGEPITDVDLHGAARRVEMLPWVLDAVVERHLPGTVRILVVEREAVAAARPDGVEPSTPFALLDATGHVVGHAVSPMGLPVVDVLDSLPDPGTRLPADTAQVLAVAAAMPQSIVSQIGRIWATDGEVRLARRAGGEVLVGGAENLDEKLLALETVLDQVDLSCLSVLDVRVASAPALTREEQCQ